MLPGEEDVSINDLESEEDAIINDVCSSMEVSIEKNFKYGWL